MTPPWLLLLLLLTTSDATTIVRRTVEGSPTETILKCGPAESFIRTHMAPDFETPRLVRRLDWFHDDSLVATYQQPFAGPLGRDSLQFLEAQLTATTSQDSVMKLQKPDPFFFPEPTRGKKRVERRFRRSDGGASSSSTSSKRLSHAQEILFEAVALPSTALSSDFGKSRRAPSSSNLRPPDTFRDAEKCF
ncbi:unnamed protein product [Caenorhabditis auriculariae]|uniref:Uncharacterized protein n=1 Tax=Caenorhabditis auriculariae TaxID=2777116 RepID=A0A8S1HDD2_9PELO|nr:unnamed protein product [Caenorhabditis auriculariae]